MGWALIPKDVLLYTAKNYLTPSEAYRLSRVCKKYRQYMDSEAGQKVWSTIYNRIWKPDVVLDVDYKKLCFQREQAKRSWKRHSFEKLTVPSLAVPPPISYAQVVRPLPKPITLFATGLTIVVVHDNLTSCKVIEGLDSQSVQTHEVKLKNTPLFVRDNFLFDWETRVFCSGGMFMHVDFNGKGCSFKIKDLLGQSPYLNNSEFDQIVDLPQIQHFLVYRNIALFVSAAGELIKVVVSSTDLTKTEDILTYESVFIHKEIILLPETISRALRNSRFEMIYYSDDILLATYSDSSLGPIRFLCIDLHKKIDLDIATAIQEGLIPTGAIFNFLYGQRAFAEGKIYNSPLAMPTPQIRQFPIDIPRIARYHPTFLQRNNPLNMNKANVDNFLSDSFYKFICPLKDHERIFGNLRPQEPVVSSYCGNTFVRNDQVFRIKLENHECVVNAFTLVCEKKITACWTDEEYVVLGTEGGMLHIYCYSEINKNYGLVHSIKAFESRVNTNTGLLPWPIVQIVHNGFALVCAFSDGTLSIWNLLKPNKQL